MSEAIAFDTHRFVKNLTSSGFTEAQAEALADEQAHLLDSKLATKADILAVKADILAVKADVREVKADVREVKADVREVRADIREVKSELELKIEQVRADVEVKIEKVRSDLLTWMVGALTAHAALIAGIVAGLIRFQ